MKSIAFIKKWSFKIVNNYFLLFAINGFLGMIGLMSIAKLDLLIMLSATVIAILYLSKQITTLDFFIISFICTIALIGFLQNYDTDLWYFGCRGQLYYTIFFFIGRYSSNNIRIFQKGLWPFLLVCVIGLILYIASPSWYLDFKMQMWDGSGEILDNRVLEMSRLSAFWEYPYWVSYGCAIMYSCVIIQTYIKGYMNKKEIFILLFIAFIAILTQQRAPLFIIALVTVLYIFAGLFKKKKVGHISLRVSIGYFLLLSVCMIALFLSVIDIYMLSRLLEKIEVLENASIFIDDRANIFSDFSTKKISFWGDGIGRYSSAAFHLGKPAITDQQYLLMLHETGYFGCIGYMIIGLIVLIRGFKYFSLNYIELVVILFFLMAMTGANCLSSFMQHVAIFWICCGRICNTQLLNKKKYDILATY